jgi:hypothetical protein
MGALGEVAVLLSTLSEGVVKLLKQYLVLVHFAILYPFVGEWRIFFPDISACQTTQKCVLCLLDLKNCLSKAEISFSMSHPKKFSQKLLLEL